MLVSQSLRMIAVRPQDRPQAGVSQTG
jgi:hypothetical protein